jgi:hypothetical protein
VTLNSLVATTADINGGTIDATTIGGSSPAVGNFTTVSAASAVFTTATITTVNTTTLDLTNLEVTNIKAKDGTASMVIDDATGKVNVTTVSAASMNAAVAAITTGSVTNLTATSASVASMNAGVALLTTATVTTLNASGASIASANIGNLQFTAASIASINAGVAVINNLTATSASIASANVGVALITTGTVTALTATGASVASANVGTAVITGLTVTGASIASVNAGTATLSGNLTLNGGTANGVLYLNGSKVATSGTALVFDGTNFGVGTSNPAAYGIFVVNGASAALHVNATSGASALKLYEGAGTGRGGISSLNGSDGLSFLQGTTEAMRLTSTSLYTASGINVGIGTSSPSVRLMLEQAANSAPVTLLRLNNSGTTGGGPGIASRISFTAGATALGYIQGSNYASGATGLQFSGDGTNAQATLDSSGNLGLGVAPSPWGSSTKAAQVSILGLMFNPAGNTNSTVTHNAYYDGTNWKYIASSVGATRYEMTGASAGSTHSWSISAGGTAGNTISFTQAMTLESGGQLLVGTTTKGAGNNNNTFFTVAGGATVYTSLIASGGQELNLIAQSGLLGVYARTNDPLLFGTNNAERARITSGGYSKFSNSGSYYSSTGSYHELRSNAAADYIAQISTSQSTGADCYGIRILYENAAPNGTTNPFWQCQDSTNVRGLLRSNGGLENYSANNVNIASDERLKKDIAPLSSVWGKVKDIEVVNYRYKDCNEGDPLLYGVIAQQVQPIVPDLVVVTREATETEPEYYGIREQPIYWLAIKALQEAMTRIEQLEAKVAALESK